MKKHREETMEKYPRSLENAKRMGINVYSTNKENLEGVLFQLVDCRMKVRQICFGPGVEDVLIVLE